MKSGGSFAPPAPWLASATPLSAIEAFGGHGEVVEARDELVPAYKCAAASGKPALIEVRMNPEQVTNRCSIRDLRAQASGKEK
jgi:acetolactate synthase-1/2/3 large subunit